MQLSIFENAARPKIEFSELFEAYVACRKNKRYMTNALAFEIGYERELSEKAI